jgi:hypothetical protein
MSRISKQKKIMPTNAILVLKHATLKQEVLQGRFTSQQVAALKMKDILYTTLRVGYQSIARELTVSEGLLGELQPS